MIKSFKDQATEDFFGGKTVKKFSGFKKAAERKLTMVDNAVQSWRLEVSTGEPA